MKLESAGRSVSIVFLLAILIASMFWIGIARAYSYQAMLSAGGSISYWPDADIAVDPSKVIGVNNLSLGFQMDWHRWHYLIDRAEFRQLAQDVNVKLIRAFDFRRTAQWGEFADLMPCTRWNEETKTGTWDWTMVDALTSAIFDVGAEPLFCLGFARSGISNYIPPGMAVNPDTELPYPESYAAYAAEWVKHFKQTEQPVRFYQIMNEPSQYFGWYGTDTERVGYYVELWNVVARAMRQQNPNILLSQDTSTVKRVLNYWLEHGDDIDYLDFHKYESGTAGQLSDAEMFRRGETLLGVPVDGGTYSIASAREKWFDTRGKWLPTAINSESNFNSAWGENGTDPKIQQMAGAVWLALVLRAGMIQGLSYNVYFEFSSSKQERESKGNGWGFGMVNEDDNKPWYPYYVYRMIGPNLAVGDEMVDSSSSLEAVRVVAWRNNGKTNVLLIHKETGSHTVSLNLPSGSTYMKIDDPSGTSYTNPQMETGNLQSNQVTLTGYTVMLIKSP